MSRIYLASSWRNPHHRTYMIHLKNWGHQVYDFTAKDQTITIGGQECKGFSWQQIGAPEDLSQWEWHQYVAAITSHGAAAAGYLSDLRHMEWADTCVLLLPCGRSAHLEAGYMKGRNKRVIIHCPEKSAFVEPELMYLLADNLTFSDHELSEVLHD